MPYGTPTKTVQSICTEESPIDGKPYWLKVRTQITVKEWGWFNAQVSAMQAWLKDAASATQMPDEVAESYASLILDWNIEQDDPTGGLDPIKRPVTAAAVQELNLSDLVEVADVVSALFGGKPRAGETADPETLKNGSGSTTGSRASQESSLQEESSISQLTSVSLST